MRGSTTLRRDSAGQDSSWGLPRMLIPLLLVAGCVFLPTAGRAQGSADPTSPQNGAIDVEAIARPVGSAMRTDEAVLVDGHLNEAVWANAPVMGGFIQSQPDRGMPATEPTEVRIVYDDDRLYIGVIAFDVSPELAVIRSLERDFPGLSTRDGDIFGITLDTFLDRRNSFIVLINPHGAYRDGQTFDNSRSTDFGWDGELEVRTQILSDRWTVEVSIPWRVLRFDSSPGEQSWGANFLRRVRRKNEDTYWAPLDRRDPVHRMAKAGTLNGLVGLGGTRNLSVKPFLLVDDAGGAQLDDLESEPELDGGFDVKYGITPGLTLDLTYRTDFSQVEVDQQRVNLTRFPLFFPEQRDFFVENSGSFTFGDQTERSYRMGTSLRDFTLFQSRRIGLSGGALVPIVAGARLSGRTGPLQLGFLNIQTESMDGLSAQNFSVARVRGKLGEGADFGAMVINRSATDSGFEDDDNTSVGIDANVRLLGGLVLNSYFARTRSPDIESGEFAGRFSAAWRSLHWNASAQYRDIGEGFNPEVGFIRRTGVRHSYATAGYHVRPRGVNEAAVYAAGTYITGRDNLLLTRRGEVGVEVDLQDGGRLTGSYAERVERLEEPFEIGGQIIAPGRYDFGEARLSYQSNAGRDLSGRVSVTGGGFFDGDRRSVAVSGRWQANFRLSVEGSFEFNRIALPDATFNSNVYGTRVKYSFSTTAFASAFVQYNDETEELTSNVRFNVIHAPLSDVFLVYSERRRVDTGNVLQRLITLKVTRYLAL